MAVRLLVVFMTVWLVSTLTLARLPWFQRGDDHPDDGGDGAGLVEDAESWLSSL